MRKERENGRKGVNSRRTRTTKKNKEEKRKKSSSRNDSRVSDSSWKSKRIEKETLSSEQSEAEQAAITKRQNEKTGRGREERRRSRDMDSSGARVERSAKRRESHGCILPFDDCCHCAYLQGRHVSCVTIKNHL